MSSSSAVDMIHGGKLLVHVAENGRSLEIRCNESTLVGVVHQFLASVSGIPSNDQLLLCLDMKLDPQCPLSDYKLPSDDRELFLFNKMRLQPNTLPPSPEQVDIVEVTDPSLPSSSHDDHHLLDEAADPALKALPSYERQFRYHYHLGHAIYSRTQAKFDKCHQLLSEAKVQERAVEVARANLEQFYRVVNQSYTDFMRRYNQQYRYHSDILVNFTRDVERLKTVKLHPAIQTDTRKCLLDFVKEENLPKLVDNCRNSHKQLNNKISQFKQMFIEITPKMEDLLCDKADVPVRNMEIMIKDNIQNANEEKSIMQSLSKDVSTVKKLIDDCSSAEMSRSTLRPHDAVSALGPMYEVHDKSHLPRMTEIERSTGDVLDFCRARKDEMNTHVHVYMQKIAYMSYVMKDAKLQFHVFKEAIRHQDDLFANLRLVRGVGPAYRASLAEIVRRKASSEVYAAAAFQLAEKLASKRESEIRRREEFLRTHGPFVPTDVMSSMGLHDMPGPCDVRVGPSDARLIDVDMSDVDRYAPPSLVGDNETSPSPADAHHEEEVEEAAVGTEVEIARLKAELASAVALMCSFDIGGGDGGGASLAVREALRMKDEYVKRLWSVMRAKQSQCSAYEDRIRDLERRLSDRYEPVSDSGDGEVTHMDAASSVSRSLYLDENMPDCLGVGGAASPSKAANDDDESGSSYGERVSELQTSLKDKENQLAEAETKLKNVSDEVASLRRDLLIRQKLLDESQLPLSNCLSLQMNCAHLENCLHEAREEAETHLCAVDRRVSEYNALRSSTVKTRGIFGRLRICVTSARADPAAFADSLRALSHSLASSTSEADDEAVTEVRSFVQALADKVGTAFSDAVKSETANEQLVQDLAHQKHLVKTLYAKNQLEKQAGREKMACRRFHVHEVAAFVRNGSGHYEAVNDGACPNYYLSAESVSLLSDHLPGQPLYVMGQIVHVERKTASTPNPYGLPPGSHYSIVTVAVLPHTSPS